MPSSMRGLWLEEQRLSFRSDLPIPVPGPKEALIRIKLAGICSTDLELVRGYYPFTGIPGHEFVGEVVASKSDPAWVGKRVVGEINIACWQCEMCKADHPRHCLNRRTLGIHNWNGVFADYIVLPLVNLHEIPPEVPDKAAVFTEPLAAAHEILDQVEFQPEDRVLLIGAGRLGQLIAQVIQGKAKRFEVAGKHPKQKEILQKLQIPVISTAEIGDRQYEVVIEATGSPDGFALALRAIRPMGKIILKSTYAGKVNADFSKVVVDEVSLIGSRCGNFEPALQLLKTGQVDPTLISEATYPLERGLEAFEHAARGGALKIFIQPGLE